MPPIVGEGVPVQMWVARMASTGFLFRLSRSTASFSSFSCCLTAVGKHASDLNKQNRCYASASSDSGDEENTSEGATSTFFRPCVLVCEQCEDFFQMNSSPVPADRLPAELGSITLTLPAAYVLCCVSTIRILRFVHCVVICLCMQAALLFWKHI